MFNLAKRNIQRRPAKTLLTCIIIFITILILTASLFVFTSLKSGIDLASNRLGADILLQPAEVQESYQNTFFTAEPVNIYIENFDPNDIKTMEGVEDVTPQFFTQTLDQSCCSTVGVTRVVGIDFDNDFIIRPWLHDDIQHLDENGIILGSNAPEFYGNKIAILGKQFIVQGMLEPTGTGVDETIFMDINTARTIAKESPYLENVWKDKDPMNCLSAIMIKVKSDADSAEVAERISAAYPELRAQPTSNLITNISTQFFAFAKVLGILVLALSIVSFLALYGRYASMMESRRKEIGLMRALGVSKQKVLFSLLLEVVMLALLSGLIGAISGAILGTYTFNYLHSSLSLPGYTHSNLGITLVIFAGVLISIFIAIAAALPHAYSSASIDPQEAIARGELR